MKSILHTFLGGLLFICSFNACAHSDDEMDDRLDEIDAYESINGVWKGSFDVKSMPELLYELAEKDGQTDMTYEVMLMLAEDSRPMLLIQFDEEEGYIQVGDEAKMTPDQMGWNIRIENEGGTWIERYRLTFSRIAEKEAALTFTRTVHNWLISEENKHATFYSVFCVGSVTKQ